MDPVFGETGGNYLNGDGVLFYPGTDTRFPQESYGVQGPFASLRMKHWRRGIQDVDYLTMAADIDPVRVQQMVDDMAPKVLWEYGVEDINDPTWVLTDISWSTDPDVWEAARAELAGIIEDRPSSVTDRSKSIPEAFALHQNYPNPFNPATTIEFAVPMRSAVNLRIFDTLGREVAKLVDEELQPGTYKVTFEAEGLSSGVYFFRIKAGSYFAVKKAVLMR